MLEIQKFCKEHEDYEILLSQKPYCITTKHCQNDTRVLFKYNQINSDFSLKLVRECRGIILDKRDWSIVCRPYEKFGNYGEGYVPEIDWTTAEVTEKIDGSLIKVYFFDGEWRVSTNGMIEAHEADIMTPYNGIRNYLDLFSYALHQYGIKDTRYGGAWNRNICLDLFFDSISPGENDTFLFELATPLNKVVVPWDAYHIYPLSIIDNRTGTEVDRDLVEKIFPEFAKVKVYPLTSIEECVQAAKTLPYTEEGYVVRDKHNNRLKVKSPAYVAVHHIKGEGTLSVKRGIKLIQANEIDEFLSYFPEYESVILNIQEAYATLRKVLQADYVTTKWAENLKHSRKDIAIQITKTRYSPPFCFGVLDKKWSSVAEYLDQARDSTLESMVTEFMEKQND